ncbi:DUF805 domain-containing protein [Prochlorococcus sp. MIT 1307]|uniref:DUF805 domain-containing protein n=1 Tax=Prochlorococcus sp. MIT 1307 TaxID=3096219 RepID=UPI0039BF95B1
MTSLAKFLKFFEYLYLFGSLITYFSLSIRRLRDLVKSIYWVVILLIPVLNLILILAWFTKPQLNIAMY